MLTPKDNSLAANKFKFGCAKSIRKLTLENKVSSFVSFFSALTYSSSPKQQTTLWLANEHETKNINFTA